MYPTNDMNMVPYHNNRFSGSSYEQPYNSMLPYSGSGGYGHGMGHGYAAGVGSYGMGAEPFFNDQPYGMYNSGGYMNGSGSR